MVDQPHRPVQVESERDGYPQLDQPRLARIVETLAEVVSVLHGGNLSAAQMQELTSSLKVQAANCEVLHRFQLRNSDEPAFAVQLSRAPDDD